MTAKAMPIATSAGILAENSIVAFVDKNFTREMAFLAEVVKVPTDNPPGDCAPHAARTAQLLTELGFEVEATT